MCITEKIPVMLRFWPTISVQYTCLLIVVFLEYGMFWVGHCFFIVEDVVWESG